MALVSTKFGDGEFGEGMFAVADETPTGLPDRPRSLQWNMQRLSGTTLDAQGAANAWAGTSDVTVVAENWMVDPGFEYGENAWFAYSGATLDWDATQAHSGTRSIHAYAGTAPAVIQYLRDDLQRSQTYTVSAWVYQPEDATIPVQFRHQDLTGSTDGPTVLTPGAWAQITHTFTTQSSADTDKIYVRGTTAGADFWMDDATLVTGATAHTIVPGVDYELIHTATPNIGQGVAYSNGFYYTIWGTRLTKYDSTWTEVSRRDISGDYTATTTHVSAPLALGDYLYAPVHNDPNAIIIVWRLDDLSLVRAIDVTSAPDMASAALGWDPVGREFIVAGYYPEEDTLQRYDEDFNYVASIPTDVIHPQGVLVLGGRIYIHGDHPTLGRGLVSVEMDGTGDRMDVLEADAFEPEGVCVGPGGDIVIATLFEEGGSMEVRRYRQEPHDGEYVYRFKGTPGTSTPQMLSVGPGPLSLLAALNHKNGTTGLGLLAVLNELAGTSKLGVNAAASKIEG